MPAADVTRLPLTRRDDLVREQLDHLPLGKPRAGAKPSVRVEQPVTETTVLCSRNFSIACAVCSLSASSGARTVSARLAAADSGRSAIEMPIAPRTVSPAFRGNVAHSPGASVSGCTTVCDGAGATITFLRPPMLVSIQS